MPNLRCGLSRKNKGWQHQLLELTAKMISSSSQVDSLAFRSEKISNVTKNKSNFLQVLKIMMFCQIAKTQWSSIHSTTCSTTEVSNCHKRQLSTTMSSWRKASLAKTARSRQEAEASESAGTWTAWHQYTQVFSIRRSHLKTISSSKTSWPSTPATTTCSTPQTTAACTTNRRTITVKITQILWRSSRRTTKMKSTYRFFYYFGIIRRNKKWKLYLPMLVLKL